MPKDKTVQAPTVLPEDAQLIWRSAFDEAYQGSCASKSGEGQQDACAAAQAWSIVKESYRKTDDGQWVERSFEECEVDIGNVPLPGSLYESPVSAGLFWCRSYVYRFNSTRDISDAASHAWTDLKNRYNHGSDGIWNRKNGVADEPVSEEAVTKVEMAEPVINRSAGFGAFYRTEGTAIILDDVAPEQEEYFLQNHAREAAERPNAWPWQDWSDLHPILRTVEAVVRHKRECRAYDAAVSRARKQGWDARRDSNGSGEVVFSGWNQVGEDNQRLVQAILVSKQNEGQDPDDWQLQVMSSIQASTLSARAAPGMKRFRGPVV